MYVCIYLSVYLKELFGEKEDSKTDTIWKKNEDEPVDDIQLVYVFQCSEGQLNTVASLLLVVVWLADDVVVVRLLEEV